MRSTITPPYCPIFPFSGRLASYELPLKSHSFSTGSNDPKGAGGSIFLDKRHDLIQCPRTYNLLAMETSLFAFATDLHDEGLDTVLGNLQDRAGVDGLTLAVAYHDARDLFPHNPVHKVR